jgi:hypothetical protein
MHTYKNETNLFLRPTHTRVFRKPSIINYMLDSQKSEWAHLKREISEISNSNQEKVSNL